MNNWRQPNKRCIDKKLLAAVKDFASGYNTFLSSAEAADNKSITKSAKNLVNAVASNLKLLSDAGISIDEKGKLWQKKKLLKLKEL